MNNVTIPYTKEQLDAMSLDELRKVYEEDKQRREKQELIDKILRPMPQIPPMYPPIIPMSPYRLNEPYRPRPYVGDLP